MKHITPGRMALCVVLSLSLMATACSEAEEPDCGATMLEDVTQPPDIAIAARGSVTLAVKASNTCGPVEGTVVQFAVTLGGGSVASGSVTTGAEGTATSLWTMGVAPVRNEVVASVPASGDVTPVDWFVNAAPDRTVAMARFGEVEAFLAGEGHEGSTEDLAFVGEGADAKLVMGAPEGLIEVAVDGTVTRRTLSGEPVGRAWGLAAAADGVIWAIDAEASTLIRIAADGEVTTELTDNGTEPLKGPNYVAVGPDGHVYVTDPCLGQVIRFDPADKKVVATLQFDLETQGGPNGLAFGSDGRLYGLTENTSLLCQQFDIAEPEDKLAQLFVVALTADGFGTPETLATELGVFGDGLAFDAEDNLYMVVDTVKDLALEASLVLVRRPLTGEIEVLVDSSPDVIANVAFGRGPYGETTLYAALLEIPGLTPGAQRGLLALDLGIEGLPLSF